MQYCHAHDPHQWYARELPDREAESDALSGLHPDATCGL